MIDLTPPIVPQAEYVKDVQQLIATNYFGVASFVILLYDHFITFDDEVKFIWLGHKKFVSYLFLLNRYLTPLGFAININAYTYPKWTPEICAHFVRYEGSMTVIGLSVSSLIMAARVIAMYYGNRPVLAFITILWCILVGVNAWLLTWGIPVVHPQGIRGCSMIYSPVIGGWAAAAAWLPLLYDTSVVALLMYRTRSISRGKVAGQSRIVTTLIKDGLMYYSVILAANVTLVSMIIKSDPGIKNICAQFQLLITVTMISRITLNLRRNMHGNPDPTSFATMSVSVLGRSVQFKVPAYNRGGATTETTTIGGSVMIKKSYNSRHDDLEADIVHIVDNDDSYEMPRIRHPEPTLERTGDAKVSWRDYD